MMFLYPTYTYALTFRNDLTPILDTCIEILFRLLDFQELTRIRSNDLILAVRCDDLDGRVLGPRKEDTLSDIRFEQLN